MPHTWPLPRAIAYGGDYNPEQWPREVWDADVALMRDAGVNLVSIGIFSWALLEPRQGEYDFAWLDELLDLLHANGIAVDLGTPTASPAAWFFAAHPDARVVTREGVVLGFGSRGMASHSHPAYRAAATAIAGRLAQRYADHPAVVMWHVHNEYGAPVGQDYSPAAAVAFRGWLRRRYGSLDALNAAWGTAFWGQRYGDWEHVGVPAAAPSVANPGQSLDFARFTDHQLRGCFIAERDAIRAYAGQPITTNFMAAECPTTDLWAWAREIDIISNDHYLTAADPRGHVGLAMAADLTRSVARGNPWILMEHSTSAVNWQPRNVAKRAGEMARNSLSHLARGADAILFFQWRASRYGAEKFHSAMLPHAGTTSRVWREVVELGGRLAALGEMQGSRVRAEVAILWDTESHWAQSLQWRPSVDVDPKERTRAYYERLWRDGLTVDFVHPEADLSGYRLIVAPASYLLTQAAAANLTSFVEAGGTLLVSYFCGIVDENDAVHAGGYLAPLREALGVAVEEFLPLRAGERARVAWHGQAAYDADHDVSGDAPGDPQGNGRYGHDEDPVLDAEIWQDDLALHGAQVVATNLDGPGAGRAAITRHRHGRGTGWYVATHLGIEALAPVLAAVYADAGVHPPRLGSPGRPQDVEIVSRHHADGTRYDVVLNHLEEDVHLPCPGGTDLFRGRDLAGELRVPAGAAAVVRVAPARSRAAPRVATPSASAGGGG